MLLSNIDVFLDLYVHTQHTYGCEWGLAAVDLGLKQTNRGEGGWMLNGFLLSPSDRATVNYGLWLWERERKRKWLGVRFVGLARI